MFYKFKSKIYFLNTLVFFICAALIFINSGCSSRNESPVLSGDSTLVYPPKSSNGIIAAIMFSNKVSRKTGEPIGTGTMFSIKDKAKLYAVVELKNRELNSKKDLMFHLDWIEPGGNSFYKKRIDILSDNSAGTITSSISISPEKRQPGNYLLRFYLFRELIAEKKFLLTNEPTDSLGTNLKKIAESLAASITFSKRINSKTGEVIGAGKVFSVKDKAAVYATIKLENKDTSINQPLTFYADWVDANDSSLYRKKIELADIGASFTFTGSISISPEKRKPGNYKLRIHLFKKIIAQENFKLVQSDIKGKVINTKVNAKSITAGITLCKNVSKKTGEPIDTASVFIIKDKAKVFAVVSLENQDTSAGQKLKFILDWIGPGDSSIYRKKIDIASIDSVSTISSSISISPEKREPGNYIFRVFLLKELIAEYRFELKVQSD